MTAAAVARTCSADRTQPGNAGTVSFGTEAGLYAQAGIPTVVCGPGDIGRAHKADEWIGIDELAEAGPDDGAACRTTGPAGGGVDQDMSKATESKASPARF